MTATAKENLIPVILSPTQTAFKSALIECTPAAIRGYPHYYAKPMAAKKHSLEHEEK
jgi:hypothetical protein